MIQNVNKAYKQHASFSEDDHRCRELRVLSSDLVQNHLTFRISAEK